LLLLQLLLLLLLLLPELFFSAPVAAFSAAVAARAAPVAAVQCISVRGVKSASVDVEGSEAPKAPRAVAKKVLAMREDKALRQLEVNRKILEALIMGHWVAKKGACVPACASTFFRAKYSRLKFIVFRLKLSCLLCSCFVESIFFSLLYFCSIAGLTSLLS
jgi:hypothetical protein